jgi:hypothetical protein
VPIMVICLNTYLFPRQEFGIQPNALRLIANLITV